MDLNKRRDLVFIILAGFFVTNAIVAELIGGKIINFFGVFDQSAGIILWPVVFLLTDLINEHYGRNGVRKLTYVTVGLIAYTFLLLTVAISFNAVPGTSVTDDIFKTVFGQSRWIIIGSITAFFVSQLVDVYVFWKVRTKTSGKHIWLRATLSTAVSQLVDTSIVQFIAFVVPGEWTLQQYLHNATFGYMFKLLVAVLLIPLIYAGHRIVAKYLHDNTTASAEEPTVS